MKRLWLGIALMGILLGLGIAVTVGMYRICAPISQALEQASQAQSWEQAVSLSTQARSRWEHWRNMGASVVDHESMEEIDALFRAMDIYVEHRDLVRFSESCVQLAAMTDAIAESQSVNWWHIF